MDARDAAAATRELLTAGELADSSAMADALRAIWRRAAPPPGPDNATARDWGIDDPDYEALGVPVPILTAMGKEVGKVARSRVTRCLPLARVLWDDYGREGRIVAVVSLGPMELVEPEAVVPALYEMAQTCVFWEDCDQLAMKALEPILRKDPVNWLERVGKWVVDENKWVSRAGLTAVGRLPMKETDYTARCVELVVPALGSRDTDVKRALSFALRVCARGNVEPVKEFIAAQHGVTDADSLWVLCDVIRSLWKALLPQFVDLLPVYQTWLETGEPAVRRSVEGAIRLLEGVQLRRDPA
jgi:3-methyladenine DNA glycosylase AlkD